ncbi:MAG: asparaginase [Dysgonamonadaceae bacterium]|jgi:L-asparaginase|nr:asparaginase [Dysgonamonadaceae bacterium]
MLDLNASVLLIYTGGTIGMIEDSRTGSLKPVDFNNLKQNVSELKRLKFNIDATSFAVPVDSSDMGPAEWQEIVRIIETNYEKYDGFVILHGTDTMAYTASALSFMMQNLTKPVILTGSQLPIGKIRTDAKENLITALEIAVDKDPDGRAFVPEVCIFFQNLLMRGNRTTKINAANFKAFNSFNYPILAEAGTNIVYQHDRIFHPAEGTRPEFHYLLDHNVAIIKLFPGISAYTLNAIFEIPSLKGVVLETYGSGNAPGGETFLKIIKNAVSKGIVMVNVTQCASGTVSMDRYENGRRLQATGVISGRDITTESAVAKLMFLLGHGYAYNDVVRLMNTSVAGEVTVE